MMMSFLNILGFTIFCTSQYIVIHKSPAKHIIYTVESY